jgi:hypothetical protein
LDVEGYVIHGTKFAFRASAKNGLAKLKHLSQIADFEQGHEWNGNSKVSDTLELSLAVSIREIRGGFCLSPRDHRYR